jgi:hypothetical protein
MTRLSRLHTSDPPLAIAFPRGGHLATWDLKQKNNQGIPNRSHVPQTDPLAIRLHNLDKKRDREKATNHMKVKIRKIDIKLKRNFMSMIANRARQKVSRT